MRVPSLLTLTFALVLAVGCASSGGSRNRSRTRSTSGSPLPSTGSHDGEQHASDGRLLHRWNGAFPSRSALSQRRRRPTRVRLQRVRRVRVCAAWDFRAPDRARALSRGDGRGPCGRSSGRPSLLLDHRTGPVARRPVHRRRRVRPRAERRQGSFASNVSAATTGPVGSDRRETLPVTRSSRLRDPRPCG